MLNKIVFAIMLGIALSVLNGCQVIPKGEAPTGEIIQITTNKAEFTRAEAYEYLATSLMSSLMTLNINNFSMSCESGDCLEIAKKLRGIICFEIEKNTKTDFSLKSEYTENNEFKLILIDNSKDTILWSDSVKINKN